MPGDFRGEFIFRLYRMGIYQCWAGIEKKDTRGYEYLTNQPRPFGTGDGYDMSSSILARVELNTRARVG